MKPITPKECADKKLEQIPDFVIEAFNELIAANYKNYVSRFEQKKVTELIAKKLNRMVEDVKCEAYENRWYNIEDIYEKAGWTVEYVCPDFTENFNSYFKFIEDEQ